VIIKETFSGKDLLNLIDEITSFITDNFASSRPNRPTYLDLKVKEFTTNSLQAIAYYVKGDFENAIQEDSTFALAYLASGNRILNFSLSKFEARRLADKAFAYRSKLPLQKQSEALILKNLAYDQFENAEALVKLQLEIDPSDPTYNNILYNVYGRTKNMKAYTAHASKSFENNSTPTSSFYYLDASLIKEDYDNILDELDILELMQPEDNEIFSLKIIPQLLKGDLIAATKTQNNIKLIHPHWENLTKVYDKALAYLKDHKVTKETLRKFEGEYRSDKNEQTLTSWIENNALLTYISNQRVTSNVVAGEHTLIEGHALTGYTFQYSFSNKKNNIYYAQQVAQNSPSGTVSTWFWKVDDAIKKAEALLAANKLDSAHIAYTKAIEANPTHYYLKDALAHLNYLKNIDSVTLINQYKAVLGTYGQRKVWVEKGKLFYSRMDDPEFGQIQLLPISKNRYVNLTRLRENVEFAYNQEKVIASFTWQFDVDKMTWMKLDNKLNYFLKEK
jgi:hypothetical protein